MAYPYKTIVYHNLGHPGTKPAQQLSSNPGSTQLDFTSDDMSNLDELQANAKKLPIPHDKSFGWSKGEAYSDVMAPNEPVYPTHPTNIQGPQPRSMFEPTAAAPMAIPSPSDRARDQNQNLEFDEYEVSPDNLMVFSGPRNFLSMMHMADLTVDNNLYKSIEHYYQASKLYALCGPTFSAQIAMARTSGEAKKIARNICSERGISRRAVEKWKHSQGLMVLNYAVYAKFNQHPKLAVQLMATGNKILVHAHKGDSFFDSNAAEDETKMWAENHRGEVLKIPREIHPNVIDQVPLIAKGKNLLGVICMNVRRELKLADCAAQAEKFLSRLNAS